MCVLKCCGDFICVRVLCVMCVMCCVVVLLVMMFVCCVYCVEVLFVDCVRVFVLSVLFGFVVGVFGVCVGVGGGVLIVFVVVSVVKMVL